MVFEVNTNPRVVRKIFSVVCVLRKRIVTALNKEIRFFNNPASVHTCVVRNHIRSKANSSMPQSCTKIFQSFPATKIIGNIIFHQTVSTCCSFWISADLLDAFTCITSLPQTNKPKTCKSFITKSIKFFIRDFIKAVNRSAIFFCKLIKPYKNSFCHKNNFRHPFTVGTKAFIFVHEIFKAHYRNINITAIDSLPCSFFFFAQCIHSRKNSFEPFT